MYVKRVGESYSGLLTCSLIVNGPGLREIPQTRTEGTKRAQARPKGKTTSCATSWGQSLNSCMEVEAPSTHAIDADTWVSEEEELVHAGEHDGPNDSKYPCPQRRRRHLGVVKVCYRGPYFGIR